MMIRLRSFRGFSGPAPGRGPTESRTASAAVSSSDGTPSFMLFSFISAILITSLVSSPARSHAYVHPYVCMYVYVYGLTLRAACGRPKRGIMLLSLARSLYKRMII